jgi:hypothetical protein
MMRAAAPIHSKAPSSGRRVSLCAISGETCSGAIVAVGVAEGVSVAVAVGSGMSVGVGLNVAVGVSVANSVGVAVVIRPPVGGAKGDWNKRSPGCSPAGAGGWLPGRPAFGGGKVGAGVGDIKAVGPGDGLGVDTACAKAGTGSSVRQTNTTRSAATRLQIKLSSFKRRGLTG